MREFDVPDSNFNQPEFSGEQHDVADHVSFRKEMVNQPINPASKSRIEHLIGLFVSRKDVKIAGETFRIRTLKSRESAEAINETCKKDHQFQFAFHAELKVQTLARSIESISGIDFSTIVGSSDIEDKIRFIEELDDVVTSMLHKEYTALLKKFEIKTDEDLSEVISDIKK